MAHILVIGSGGREHAIASTLARSAKVGRVTVSPGNAGTQTNVLSKISSPPADFPFSSSSDSFPHWCYLLSRWCRDNRVILVVVGPEDPLANGIADEFKKHSILCFGPTRAAAQIESSKYFAKDFMTKFKIPTAGWASFTNASLAKEHILRHPLRRCVVKADGLAAGKGVVVAQSEKAAFQAIDELMVEKKYGKSCGDRVIVEELLEGFEVSCLCFTDGNTVKCMPLSQDHKKLLEGDKGPNTGGMGAYAPCSLVDKQTEDDIHHIMEKTVLAMNTSGVPFTGVLYGGFMVTKTGPQVLEFNCRFGDPETQMEEVSLQQRSGDHQHGHLFPGMNRVSVRKLHVGVTLSLSSSELVFTLNQSAVILPLLQSDLFDIMKSCCEGVLDKQEVVFEKGMSAVAVVLASGGYPEKYAKGLPITGLETLSADISVFHAGTSYSNPNSDTGAKSSRSSKSSPSPKSSPGSHTLVTNGGRVLAVVSVESSLDVAAAKATQAASVVSFDGAFYRKDIGRSALQSRKPVGSLTYADAGVDIQAGENLVSSIKPLCQDTQIPGCVGNLGMFGAVFDLKLTEYTDPLLVSGTDGIGTKLLIALECKHHSTIGQDLVAMCVNDILCHGARPLYFLDYFATGKLDINVAKEVIAGIAVACKKAGCALVGGETAEMPDMYPGNKYDLAGFAVGAVERSNYLPRITGISSGDVLIGLPSSGLHSNGFSMVRKILSAGGLKYSDACPYDDTMTIGRSLLTPTQIYTTTSLLNALASGQVKAVSHITGGGLLENLPRVLPAGCKVYLDARRWTVPPVFGWLQEMGDVATHEMSKTFNCGLGLVLVTSRSDADTVCSATGGQVVGRVLHRDQGEAQVDIDYLLEALQGTTAVTAGGLQKRVAVLISGSGTNLQALIDSCEVPSSDAKIVLVISNKEDVQGLERATRSGIDTKVISHKGYDSREEFDSEITEALELVGAEIICLAGFMRILSGKFVARWSGRLINIHPSLLPSFKGIDAHRQVLEAGVKLSGCTVHHVAVEVDSGAILEQEAVPVLPGDTVESLQERVKLAEHKAFPRALHHLAASIISAEGSG